MILEWERPNYNKNLKAIKEMNEKFDYKEKKNHKVSTRQKPNMNKANKLGKKACNSYRRGRVNSLV